ncbi:MAG: hypothetical protein ACFHWZ_00240 [Phycisphaerales bacterium]
MSIPWHAIDLPTDLPTLRGMVPAVIDGKRIFISKAMASRELEVRDLIEGESAPDQAEPIN